MTENQKAAKEYLTRIRDVEKNIRYKEYELDALRYKAGGLTAIQYDKERVMTSPNNYTEMAIADIIDREQEIEEDKASIENLMGDAYEIVRKIERPEHRAIIEWFYLNGLPMYEVAKRIDMSERNAYNLHDDALESFGIFITPTFCSRLQTFADDCRALQKQ